MARSRTLPLVPVFLAVMLLGPNTLPASATARPSPQPIAHATATLREVLGMLGGNVWKAIVDAVGIEGDPNGLKVPPPSSPLRLDSRETGTFQR